MVTPAPISTAVGPLISELDIGTLVSPNTSPHESWQKDFYYHLDGNTLLDTISPQLIPAMSSLAPQHISWGTKNTPLTETLNDNIEFSPNNGTISIETHDCDSVAGSVRSKDLEHTTDAVQQIKKRIFFLRPRQDNARVVAKAKLSTRTISRWKGRNAQDWAFHTTNRTIYHRVWQSGFLY